MASIRCFQLVIDHRFNVFAYNVKGPRSATHAPLKWRNPCHSITARGVVDQMESSDDAEGSQACDLRVEAGGINQVAE